MNIVGFVWSEINVVTLAVMLDAILATQLKNVRETMNVLVFMIGHEKAIIVTHFAYIWGDGLAMDGNLMAGVVSTKKLLVIFC